MAAEAGRPSGGPSGPNHRALRGGREREREMDEDRRSRRGQTGGQRDGRLPSVSCSYVVAKRHIVSQIGYCVWAAVARERLWPSLGQAWEAQVSVGGRTARIPLRDGLEQEQRTGRKYPILYSSVSVRTARANRTKHSPGSVLSVSRADSTLGLVTGTFGLPTPGWSLVRFRGAVNERWRGGERACKGGAEEDAPTAWPSSERETTVGRELDVSENNKLRCFEHTRDRLGVVRAGETKRKVGLTGGQYFAGLDCEMRRGTGEQQVSERRTSGSPRSGSCPEAWVFIV
jgi:hypothetical protein